MTCIESCVVCNEYRILCCLEQVKNFVLFVMSIESCIVCERIESCVLHGEYSGDYRNLVWSVTSLEFSGLW